MFGGWSTTVPLYHCSTANHKNSLYTSVKVGAELRGCSAKLTSSTLAVLFCSAQLEQELLWLLPSTPPTTTLTFLSSLWSYLNALCALYLSSLWSDLSCAAELVIADSKLVVSLTSPFAYERCVFTCKHQLSVQLLLLRKQVIQV